MKQLLLDIVLPAPPAFDNLVPGCNAELIVAARSLAAGTFPERILYVWGEPGSGKSHLASALVAKADGCILGGASLMLDAKPGLLVLDDVELLDAEGQSALFNLINDLGESRLFVTGTSAPRDLNLRRDLSTRLGSGLVYQMKPLTDDEKHAALTAHAERRGFNLTPEIVNYLLRHGRRDMLSLMAMLETLDRHSLETGRAVTLPLVRDALHQSLVEPQP